MNKAKCALCKTVIQSFFKEDLVTCKCGEISIDGGDYDLKCYAKDWKNFLRLDENGHEILVKIKDGEMKEEKQVEAPLLAKEQKKEALKAVLHLMETIENLPQHAMQQPITHYDYLSLLILLASALREDCIEDS